MIDDFCPASRRTVDRRYCRVRGECVFVLKASPGRVDEAIVVSTSYNVVIPADVRASNSGFVSVIVMSLPVELVVVSSVSLVVVVVPESSGCRPFVVGFVVGSLARHRLPPLMSESQPFGYRVLVVTWKASMNFAASVADDAAAAWLALLMMPSNRGRTRPASTAMMATTMINSTSVNPA